MKIAQIIKSVLNISIRWWFGRYKLCCTDVIPISRVYLDYMRDLLSIPSITSVDYQSDCYPLMSTR